MAQFSIFKSEISLFRVRFILKVLETELNVEESLDNKLITKISLTQQSVKYKYNVNYFQQVMSNICIHRIHTSSSS